MEREKAHVTTTDVDEARRSNAVTVLDVMVL